MASLFIAKPSACMAVYVYEVHDDSPFLSFMASSMPLELGLRRLIHNALGPRGEIVRLRRTFFNNRRD
jgi:hypothetical protein